MRPGEVGPPVGRRVVLVGHGSSTEPRACRTVERPAAAIRASGPFDAVLTAYVSGGASLGDAMRSVDDGLLVVVPFFMSDGYATSVVIRRDVERHRPAGVTARQTLPVGTHPSMTQIALERAASAREGRGERVGAVLVGHGNEARPASSSCVRYHVDRLARWGWFDEVAGCYLERAPRVERVREVFGADELVVVPLFMAEGPHVREDLPARLAEALDHSRPNRGRTWRLTEPVGTHPMAGRIAIERAGAARVLGEGAGEADPSSPARRSDVPPPTGGG